MALLLAISATNCAPSVQQSAVLLKKLPPAKVNEVIVYVTKTGKKYHREDCGSLSHSSIPMPLDEARQKYEACKVCHPPE